MNERKPQNLKNHTAFDPWFHIFLLLVLLLSVIEAISRTIRHYDTHAAWSVVLSLAAIVLVFKVRLYSLKVQDRVIRLEERLRLRDLAGDQSKQLIAGLSEDQLIGLRFASDEELVALARQALAEKLDRKQIKERIKNWRPDYWRI